jgi:NADH-quinone oxidoreductase subunit M
MWEAMLIPMYLLVAVWGGPRKVYASIKFFLYTLAGSVLLLVAIIALYLSQGTFFIPAMMGQAYSTDFQILVFLAFFLAFAIKVPMFPFHTWLPAAHVEAPTAGSVILASVLLKMGTYGFLRFCLPITPEATLIFLPYVQWLSVAGILYGGFTALAQQDMKKLIAYSSVGHMGFVTLGIFVLNQRGIEGAILQMVNHGITTGALFLLVGVIYDRRHTRDLDQFGGLAKVMPVYAALFVVVTMGSVGVPGTNGFIGEFMVIAGTYVSPRLSSFSSLQAIGAAFGVILAAVYMLAVVQKVFFGPLRNPKNQHLPDVTPREGLALAPLVAMVFVIGLFPAVFLEPMKPAVRVFVDQFNAIAGLGANQAGAQLLPPDVFNEAFMAKAPGLVEERAKRAAAEAKQAMDAAAAPKPEPTEKEAAAERPPTPNLRPLPSLPRVPRPDREAP